MRPAPWWTALRRHWLTVLIGSVVVAGAGAGMWFVTGPTFRATAVVTLIPPTAAAAAGTGTFTQGNPLFYLGGLNQARDLVMSKMRASDVAALAKERFPDNEYDVGPDPLSTGPVIAITVTGSAPEPVLEQLRNLVADVPVALNDLQQQLRVPNAARVRSLTVTQDDRTETERRTQTRNALAGVAVPLVVLVITLTLLERRRLAGAGGRPGPDVNVQASEALVTEVPPRESTSFLPDSWEERLESEGGQNRNENGDRGKAVAPLRESG